MAGLKKDEWITLGMFALIAFGLLFADRWLRINNITREGFSNGSERCGVDLPPCPFPQRCLNGICVSQDIPVVKDSNPLPVVP